VTLNDGVAWGTIAGGVAGFLSFGVVLVDKWTTRPKLVTSVRKATFQNEGGNPREGEARIFFSVNLEIGNIGSEATTITRADLHLHDGKILEPKAYKNLTGGITFVVDDENTRICEKGIAFIENLKFYSDNEHSKEEKIQGTLVLTLIGGKKHKQSVTFENYKK
jgi:hypothetical protein